MYWWESYCRKLLELNPSGSLAARVELKGERAGVLTHQLLSVICRRLLSVGTLLSTSGCHCEDKTDSVCKRKLLIKEIPVLVAGNGVSVHQSVKGEGKPSSFRGERKWRQCSLECQGRGKPSSFRGWESSHISNTKLLWPITWMMNRKPKWAQRG